uniref:G_PROTEIN_RECEP_F1_2 domain-containing protein n=1 Tax=Haemonchus contortus TaxID=6289 RepID=A0A7I5EBJ7_HAECO
MALSVIHTTIESLLVVFYIFVLFIIISSKAKTLKNAFYTLFVATGIADLISLCACCFIRVNRELGLGEEFRFIMRWCLILSGAGAFAHFIGNLLITFNRYSNICLLNKYELIWTRKNIFVIVIVQYIISFAAFFHIFKAEMIYIRNEDGTVTYNGYEKSFDIISTCTYFGGCLIYATVSAYFNVRILVKWKRWSKNGRSLQHRHEDKGLMIYTMLVSSCTLLMCAQMIIRSVATFADMKALKFWISMQYFWINDVMVSIPPFFLALLSSDLRKEMVDCIRCYKLQNLLRIFATRPNRRRSVVGKF